MRTRVGWLQLALLVGVQTAAHAYFLDQGRRFDVRARIYAQVAVATEETTEKPPDISPGDILSQRNFYNPEFDAHLGDFTRGMREIPGLSVLTPDDLNFRFAWWGFYDGILDYANSKWATSSARRRARRSSSNVCTEHGLPTTRTRTRATPRSAEPHQQLHIDYSSGLLLRCIGRQSISWARPTRSCSWT
jgi:hypothetical protein